MNPTPVSLRQTGFIDFLTPFGVADRLSGLSTSGEGIYIFKTDTNSFVQIQLKLFVSNVFFKAGYYGLEPYWYLKYLFENLPEAMIADEFKALMPQNVDKGLLAGPAV